ncbi:hypothetical protein DAI22_06g132800 [Oryza sativa Japonica Group]|nr:hypothetical protein DAI22_06g132800 [Oryza sativa Japonica Group]
MEPHKSAQGFAFFCCHGCCWITAKKNAILSVGSDKRIIPFDLAARRAGSKIVLQIHAISTCYDCSLIRLFSFFVPYLLC